jgi:hypothetical protein
MPRRRVRGCIVRGMWLRRLRRPGLSRLERLDAREAAVAPRPFERLGSGDGPPNESG